MSYAGAMSDDLTTEQVGELRDDLHALKRSLDEMLDISRDGVRPVELDQPIGRISRIDAIQQQKMLTANRNNSKRRLRLVHAALASLERDEYRLCVECEEPINYRRLKAKPESRFCLDCQRAQETARQ